MRYFGSCFQREVFWDIGSHYFSKQKMRQKSLNICIRSAFFSTYIAPVAMKQKSLLTAGSIIRVISVENFLHVILCFESIFHSSVSDAFLEILIALLNIALMSPMFLQHFKLVPINCLFLLKILQKKCCYFIVVAS